MLYYRFFNEMAQKWKDKTWKKYSDVTPYCNSHRDSRFKQHQTEFSKDKWFNFYCGPWLKIKGGRCNQPLWIHKLKKFYWNIHPEERPFPKYPRNET